jgi:tetratricopeptide (TPR) repeat protein
MTTILRRGGPPALAVLAAALVYANALANGFAFDDVFVVQTNTRVHDLGNLRDIWLTPYWPQFGPELGLWRPFVIFGYALQWAVVGDAPWFFHLVNLLLHAAATGLVYALLRSLQAGRAAAFAGAIVFAVHPVHTEVVANVVGQAELIAALTTLSACLIHASRPRGTDVDWTRRIGLLMLFAAGTLAKESAIVLPALLIALDAAQGRVRPERGSLAAYARSMAMPLFLFAAAAGFYFALRVDVLGSIGGADAAPSLPFLRQEHRVLVAFRAWVEYIRLLAFPLDLSADYSPGVVLPVEGMTPLVALGGLLLLATAAIAALTPRYPHAGLPAAWLLIAALPTSNLLMPIGVVVAERLLYTPSVAVSMVVAFAWQRLAATADRRAARLATAALAAAVLAMAARTWIRNPDWMSTETVLHSVARDHPESYRSQWVNATELYRRGNRELGYEFLKLAHRIWPHDSQLLNEMAFELIGRAQFDSAAQHLERSAEITPFVLRTHVLLAQAYIGAGRYEEALQATQEATRRGASLERSLLLYAQTYEGLGRLPEAIGAWRAVVRTTEDAAWNLWARLARALARGGLKEPALAAADSARARLPPSDTAGVRVTSALRTQIEGDCYAAVPAAGAPCDDPLADWRLVAVILTRLPVAPTPETAEVPEAETS